LIPGAELDRYKQLKQLEKAGVISNLKVHSKEITYRLMDAFKYTNFGGKTKTQRAIDYTPDFTYTVKGKLIAEDVKGFVTPDFKLKAKMFRQSYPHIILRLTRKRKGIFEDID
jgi:hypothetical protein